MGWECLLYLVKFFLFETKEGQRRILHRKISRAVLDCSALVLMFDDVANLLFGRYNSRSTKEKNKETGFFQTRCRWFSSNMKWWRLIANSCFLVDDFSFAASSLWTNLHGYFLCHGCWSHVVPRKCFGFLRNMMGIHNPSIGYVD